jgi:hypothetical protein
VIALKNVLAASAIRHDLANCAHDVHNLLTAPVDAPQTIEIRE